MTNIPIQLTDHVVSMIREKYPSIKTERAFVPSVALDMLKEIKIFVVPREITSARISRSQNQATILIDLGVLYKFETGDAQEIDPITKLVEEIGQMFDSVPIGDGRCVHVENKPIYHPKHFEEWRQFTSILTLTVTLFQIYRL